MTAVATLQQSETKRRFPRKVKEDRPQRTVRWLEKPNSRSRNGVLVVTVWRAQQHQWLEQTDTYKVAPINVHSNEGCKQIGWTLKKQSDRTVYQLFNAAEGFECICPSREKPHCKHAAALKAALTSIGWK